MKITQITIQLVKLNITYTKEKPSIIVDFKFPVVSSNDDDFSKIKEKNFSPLKLIYLKQLIQVI